MPYVPLPRDFLGIGRFPVRRQPNGYTCGSTCVRMLLDYLEFRKDLSINDLSSLMGTNPLTGTTEVEMERGLSEMGLVHARPQGIGLKGKGPALAHLRHVLDQGDAVMLRTLVHGCKHWVVVHGHVPKGNFLVTCPSTGFQTWNPTRLHEAWSAREYDHFTAPGDRSLHPQALAEEVRERMASWRPVHEMSLREFTGDLKVIRDSRQSWWHRSAIDEASKEIISMGKFGQGRDMLYGIGSPFLFREIPRSGYIKNMVAFARDTGQTAGGIHNGLRWVHPSFRGQGLGAELALAAHSDPESRFLCPTSYSEAGYGSRVMAHRLAVRRALEAGLHVPDKALREEMDEPVDTSERQLRLF